MTYASSVLTSELQRAVKSRGDSDVTTAAKNGQAPRQLQYTVSQEAHEHLQRLRDYRERAKDVRVGNY